VLQSLVANRGPLPRQLAIEMHMRNAVGAIAPEHTPAMAVLFYHLTILGYGEGVGWGSGKGQERQRQTALQLGWG
jgi:hypothetical protein